MRVEVQFGLRSVSFPLYPSLYFLYISVSFSSFLFFLSLSSSLFPSLFSFLFFSLSFSLSPSLSLSISPSPSLFLFISLFISSFPHHSRACDRKFLDRRRAQAGREARGRWGSVPSYNKKRVSEGEGERDNERESVCFLLIN